ncbi:MAG TPA: hypothetical protein VGD71_22490 [Kribbella sp.]
MAVTNRFQSALLKVRASRRAESPDGHVAPAALATPAEVGARSTTTVASITSPTTTIALIARPNARRSPTLVINATPVLNCERKITPATARSCDL